MEKYIILGGVSGLIVTIIIVVILNTLNWFGINPSIQIILSETIGVIIGIIGIVIGISIGKKHG